MKVKNVSQRKYIHGSFSVDPGAEISVPDYIGNAWIKTKDFEEIKEIEQYIVEHTYEIGELPPKPDISKVKLTEKKVTKNAKRNSKRI